MKVAVISKSDRYAGGASKVAEDLALWLNQAGHLADHFVAFQSQHDRDRPEQLEQINFKPLYGNGYGEQFCRKVHQFTNRLGFRELLPVEYWFNLRQLIQDYDVIHFHDLFMSIAPATMALVARKKPTFFTVHDCSAFTGGCLYPMDCDRFTSRCHQCPQLNQSTWKQRLRDRTGEIQSIKKYIARRFPIHYIFPSHWMSEQASLALTYQVPSMVVPNAVDLAPFTYRHKGLAKEELGIHRDRQVVLVTALSLQDKRKGAAYAVRALQSVRDLNPLVITVGSPNPELREQLQGMEVMEMGFVSDANLMARIYSAADIMLFCSLADNLPLTILEAMAGSCVVVGFATGGIPDMIETGRNGILVEPRHQEALDLALRKTLTDDRLATMARQSRQDAENKFSPTLFIDRHVRLYQEAIA
ncbi:MAG: glycosyltransferase [Pseudanabaenaceae cyanobacterium bins.39]|nr:glycosyltransferase [Pseudanabaenaceae cyanobacterium bins.39]